MVGNSAIRLLLPATAPRVIRRLVRARYSSSAPLAAPTAVEARHDGMLQSIGTAKPGFDQSHFSASYKMRYGVTPTQSAAQNEI